jgi:hypothetical protein
MPNARLFSFSVQGIRTSTTKGEHSRRMLKMASQQGRRELGDRSVPLGYVAGRRATENDAGGHFQHPAKGEVAWKASGPA